MREWVVKTESIDIKTIHQQKYKRDPKIILTNKIAHEYQPIFKSNTSKVCSGFPISLRQKRWSDWPSTNFILMRSYKPHNWHQVLEYGFQELRVAITNKELIKIRYSSWKSSGIQLWSSEKRFHEVQESKFKSSGMGVFTSCTLEDKVQELIFWSSGIEQNSPHTQEVWALMS